MKKLNKINYLTNEYVFYGNREGTIAENKNNKIVINGNENSQLKEYEKKSLKEKFSDSKNASKDMKAVNTETTTAEKTFSFEPEFSVKSKKYYPTLISKGTKAHPYKYCKLYNKKSQGYYGLCWAATSATVINYRKGKNISAKKIADYMHIGYNQGGSNDDIQKAMKHYGVTYKNNADGQLTWKNTIANINKKFPICIGARHKKKGPDDWHEVTGYGYKINSKGTKYIVIWNSGVNGVGGVQIVKYRKKGSVFTYGGDAYTWVDHVSYI